MAEYPIILAHNALDHSTISGNETAGHELDRIRDGHRHTWWQSPSTAMQEILVRAKSLISNWDFESGLQDWFLYTDGSEGSVSQNTTNPLSGNADCKLEATTANNDDELVIFLNWKALLFRAGRTYRMMFRARAESENKTLRAGFYLANYTENENFYKDQTILNQDFGYFVDVTPDADVWVCPYFRMIEAGTIYIDDVIVNEVRDVDTLIIDKGHTLQAAAVALLYRDVEFGNYAWAFGNTRSYSNGPIYIAFNPIRSLSWKIRIGVLAVNTGVPVAKVPLLYFGERWTMPHNFSGSFDPHREDRFVDMVSSDRGIAQILHKYNQRVFAGSMSHLGDEDYENVKKFFEDTDNGAKPFFFSWKPQTAANDLLLLRLKGARDVPYQSGPLRSWKFDAEEVIGARVT